MVASLLFVTTSAPAQELNKTAPNTLPYKPRLFTTKAYQLEAFRVMLKEINSMAKDLNLPEDLPITRTNCKAYICLPIAYTNRSMLGTIDTKNYAYTLATGKTVSEVDVKDQQVYARDRELYCWPMSRFDTNAALKIGMQIMTQAGMDAVGLNRDCMVDITAALVEGPQGKHFVPDYYISWHKPHTPGTETNLDYLMHGGGANFFL